MRFHRIIFNIGDDVCKVICVTHISIERLWLPELSLATSEFICLQFVRSSRSLQTGCLRSQRYRFGSSVSVPLVAFTIAASLNGNTRGVTARQSSSWSFQ